MIKSPFGLFVIAVLKIILNCIIWKCHSSVCSIGYIIDNNSLNADCVPRIHAVLLEKSSVPVCRNIIFGWEKRQTLFGNVEIFLEMDYRENLWETSNQ
jgi:hypothetical protein